MKQFLVFSSEEVSLGYFLPLSCMEDWFCFALLFFIDVLYPYGVFCTHSLILLNAISKATVWLSNRLVYHFFHIDVNTIAFVQ